MAKYEHLFAVGQCRGVEFAEAAFLPVHFSRGGVNTDEPILLGEAVQAVAHDDRCREVDLELGVLPFANGFTGAAAAAHAEHTLGVGGGDHAVAGGDGRDDVAKVECGNGLAPEEFAFFNIHAENLLGGKRDELPLAGKRRDQRAGEAGQVILRFPYDVAG